MKPQLILRGNRKAQNYLMALVFPCLLAHVSAALFTACDKQNPLTVDKPQLEKQEAKPEIPPDAKVITFNPETVRFSYQGKLYAKEEFQTLFKGNEFPVMTTGTGLPEENVVYVFDSEADLNAWGKTTKLADQFVQLNAALARAKQQSVAKTNAVQLLGGSATLYDGYTRTGASFYRSVTGLVPYLASYGFDNRASSIQVFNPSGSYPITVCALYSLSYYGGSQIIFWNNTPHSISQWNDFRVYGWNNIASSMIVL